jgi:hypothetical protein
MVYNRPQHLEGRRNEAAWFAVKQPIAVYDANQPLSSRFHKITVDRSHNKQQSALSIPI